MGGATLALMFPRSLVSASLAAFSVFMSRLFTSWNELTTLFGF